MCISTSARGDYLPLSRDLSLRTEYSQEGQLRGPRNKSSPTASQEARQHGYPRHTPNPTHASDQRRWRGCILPTFSHVRGVQKNVGEVTVSEVDFFEVRCSMDPTA